MHSFSSKLRHPNIIQFLGACLDQDLLLLTEFAERGSLYDVLDRNKPNGRDLKWNISLQIMLDVARGMLYLHSRNPPIVHRDIKSLNILVWFYLITIFCNFYLLLFLGY